MILILFVSRFTKFIEAVQNGAQVIAISALLTTTMTNMKTTIEEIKEAGLRDKTIIMVGGAPARFIKKRGENDRES